jgi:hypothetical protein
VDVLEEGGGKAVDLSSGEGCKCSGMLAETKRWRLPGEGNLLEGSKRLLAFHPGQGYMWPKEANAWDRSDAGRHPCMDG